MKLAIFEFLYCGELVKNLNKSHFPDKSTLYVSFNACANLLRSLVESKHAKEVSVCMGYEHMKKSSFGVFSSGIFKS